jgi:hypothetical protein
VSAAGHTASRPSETVAGYLAALAIFIALIGVAWHPLRLILPAVVVSMIASAMGGRFQRLAFASVIVVAFCFFLGMMISVIAERPLW